MKVPSADRNYPISFLFTLNDSFSTLLRNNNIAITKRNICHEHSVSFNNDLNSTLSCEPIPKSYRQIIKEREKYYSVRIENNSNLLIRKISKLKDIQLTSIRQIYEMKRKSTEIQKAREQREESKQRVY